MKPHNYLSQLYEITTFNFLVDDIPNKILNRYEKFTIRHHFTTDLIGVMITGYDVLTGNRTPIEYLLYEKLLVDGIGLTYIILHQLYKHKEHVKNILKNIPNRIKNRQK
jgi:hypothetical protein